MEIKIQNQTIILDPPLAEARTYWYKELHNLVEVICGLEKVESGRYERYKEQDSQGEKTYKMLINKMKSYDIQEAYMMLENNLRDAETYFTTWKSYQALWDIDSIQIYDILGEKIDKWH